MDGGSASHVVSFTLRDDEGAVVAAANSQPMTTKGSVVLKPAATLSTWSPQTPVTYTLMARVGQDELNLTTAVRVFDWKGKKAKINGHALELQGFSHHPSFAGMGAMTNPRLGLFLAQTTKALGVNFWRTSHNPYEDSLYELLTTVVSSSCAGMRIFRGTLPDLDHAIGSFAVPAAIALTLSALRMHVAGNHVLGRESEFREQPHARVPRHD